MIILARHGNTFAAGDKIVTVGAGTDLPLTEEGRTQAARVASWLQTKGHVPVRFIAGPLQRTRVFAEIVGQAFNRPVEIDKRLKELDYGLWEGKSDTEIRAMPGHAAALFAWQKDGVWPAIAQWGGEPEDVRRGVRDVLLAARVASEAAFFCTSNGILRFVYALLTGKPPSDNAKVKTGHICVLVPEGTAGWRIAEWNLAP